METKDHVDRLLMPFSPHSAFVHFGEILTTELHRSPEADDAMKKLLAAIGKVKLDESIISSYKPTSASKLAFPDLPSEAHAALLVTLYLTAKDGLSRNASQGLPANIIAASKSYREMLAKKPEFPNVLLKEIVNRAQTERDFAARLKAGATELRSNQSAIRALGDNPWELSCVIGLLTFEIWVCIVLGVALVLIYVGTHDTW